MKRYYIKFSAKKKGAIGIQQTFHETVDAADKDAALLSLYEKYDHIHLPQVHQLRLRYAVTHVNKDGMRTLSNANQGQNHFDTHEAAQKQIDAMLANNTRKTLASVYNGEEGVKTLAVREVWCWGSGDAVGIYFEE